MKMKLERTRSVVARLVLQIGIISTIVLPSIALAMGGEGIAEGFLKLIGIVFIVWPISIFLTYKLTKEFFPKATKYALTAIILGPPLVLVVYPVLTERKNHAVHEKEMRGLESHYVSLCNKRTIDVVTKIQSKEPHGVLNVRHPRFAGAYTDVIWSRPLLAKQPNIAFFEEIRDGEYIASEKKWSHFFVRIDRDDPTEKGKNLEPSSKYVLEAGEEEPSDNGWILKSTIKLSERSSSRVLASTDLYFFQRRTGGFGCPDLNREVSKMLSAVFD